MASLSLSPVPTPSSFLSSVFFSLSLLPSNHSEQVYSASLSVLPTTRFCLTQGPQSIEPWTENSEILGQNKHAFLFSDLAPILSQHQNAD